MARISLLLALAAALGPGAGPVIRIQIGDWTLGAFRFGTRAGAAAFARGISALGRPESCRLVRGPRPPW